MFSQAHAAIRKSDSKAAQLLGVTITRDTPLIETNNFDLDESPDCGVIWNVRDPFAPLDPSQEYLNNLLQAEINRMRRYENIGPLQSLPADEDEDEDRYDYGFESEDDGDDADCVEEDADADDEDEDDDDVQEDDTSHTITLPRLLHTRPLCYIGAPLPPSSAASPPPSSLSPAAAAPPPSSSSSDEHFSTPWLVHTHPNIAQAERHARKARRDAHRSRMKALAILGPEASVAI